MVLHLQLPSGARSPRHIHQSDSQVVTHVRPAAEGRRMVAKVPHNSASSAPQGSPRRPARDIFLHHDRVVQLPLGADRILDKGGVCDRKVDRDKASRG